MRRCWLLLCALLAVLALLAGGGASPAAAAPPARPFDVALAVTRATPAGATLAVDYALGNRTAYPLVYQAGCGAGPAVSLRADATGAAYTLRVATTGGPADACLATPVTVAPGASATLRASYAVTVPDGAYTLRASLVYTLQTGDPAARYRQLPDRSMIDTFPTTAATSAPAAVRLATGRSTPPGATAQATPISRTGPFSPKVLVIDYDTKPGGVDDGSTALTGQLVSALQVASRYHDAPVSSAQFQIYRVAHEDNPPPLLPGAQHGTGSGDYTAIFQKYDVCGLAAAQGVNFVWIWASGTEDGGIFYAGDFLEWVATGPTFQQTYGKAVPTCAGTVVTFGFSYTRTVPLALHSTGHYMENLLQYAFGPADYSGPGGTDAYDRFDGQVSRYAGYAGPLNTATAECGDVHYPPNTTQAYDYANTTTVLSDCATYNPGDPAAEVYAPVSASTWAAVPCDPSVRGDAGDCMQQSYLTWWMQNMPGYDNAVLDVGGGPMPNWWQYLLALDTVGAGPPPTYTVTDLGTLGGEVSNAYGINGAGQVVGLSQDARGIGGAFLWRGGTMTPLGGFSSQAFGINVAGQVVGLAYTAADSRVYRAALWQGGAMADLGTLAGGSHSAARGINDAGQVVGTADTAAGTWRAVLWQGRAVADLGTLPGFTSSEAQGINAAGQVVGDAYTGDGITAQRISRAFLWQRGAMSDLGTLGGSQSYASAVNGIGQAVGAATTAGDTIWHAALWRCGAVTDLGTLPGYAASGALGINAAGQVVGGVYASDGTSHAVLWQHGTVTDLNSLLPSGSGWTLEQAVAVNDSGQIVANGTVTTAGHQEHHAFLLTPSGSPTPSPVPSPSPCASPGPRPSPVGWSAWASQGGILTDAPAAAGFNGRVYVFAKGSDTALYVKSADTVGNFTGWQDLGGILSAAPASASFNGRLYAFAKGSDNALYVKSSPDGVTWTGWDDQGGILLAPPAAASAGGKLFVFAMGTDKALYAKSTADGVNWSDWQRLGGILTAAPAAAGFQGRIYAFAKGSDNAFYVKSSADGANWTAWTDLGGTLAAAPAGAATGDGATLYAVAITPGGTVYERHSTDGTNWTLWNSLGGAAVGAPAAASISGGPLFVFVRWVDSALWDTHNP